MFEHDEVVLEAKHVTRRVPASGGRTLVANDDINLKFLCMCRRRWMEMCLR